MFGLQKSVRLKMLPTEAWNRILRSPFSWKFLARVRSSLKFLNPRTVPSALGALPNWSGPGSCQAALSK